MRRSRLPALSDASAGAVAILLFFGGCASQPTRVTEPAPDATAAPPTAIREATPEPTPKPSPGRESIPVRPAPKIATEPPSPPAPPAPPAPPSQPPAANETRPATLVGSEESSAMLDNLTAYVVSVDGLTLSAGRDGWNTPLKLKPGVHRLGVGFTRGAFAARTELLLDVKAGVAYQIRFVTDAQLFGRNSYCEFWIVDTRTGEQVLPAARVPLKRTQAGGH